MSKKNKIEYNKKYFTIAVYSFLVIALLMLFYKYILNFNYTSELASEITTILSPFLVAFLIAYITNPLIRYLEKNVFLKIKIKNKNLPFTVSRILSIMIVYILFITLVIIILIYIIPEIYHSLYIIFSGNTSDLNDSIKDLLSKFNINMTSIENTASQYYPTILEDVPKYLTTSINYILGTSVSIVSGLLSFLLSLVIAFYLLIEKELILRKFKKILYALMKHTTADKIIINFKECNSIFSKYVVGKTLDSFIIGTLCFIILLITNMPFALFISVIIGITNMIPYFGPFIGAIPGIVIILINSNLITAFWFAVIVLALQQFDGLILGPKILGDSTGLTPFWVIFSITIGGSLFGVIGMFLGVPIVAVLNHLFNKLINKRLESKKKST